MSPSPPLATRPLPGEQGQQASAGGAIAPPAPHLSLRVGCAADGRSFIAQQYATYPFRLSVNLALDPGDPNRVYAYIMNASPGILAGDELRLTLQVGDRARLYLTDQSATKIHSRPSGGAIAQFDWTMAVGDGAYVEYVPEPVILFTDGAVTQRVEVSLHPQGRLVLGEIIVPGRLARGESFDFDQLQSHLVVRRPDGQLCCADQLRLLGRANRFRQSPWLGERPIMGNFMLLLPGVCLDELGQAILAYGDGGGGLRVGQSPLPGCNGLLVRAIASRVSLLQAYQRHLLNCARRFTGQPPLPDIPK